MPFAGQIIRAIDFAGHAKVILSGTQSLTTSTNTTVQLNVVEYDESGFWDPTLFQFEIPLGFAGLYTIRAQITFDANSTGSRAFNIIHNGTRISSTFTTNNATSNTRLQGSVDRQLAEGDLIVMQGFQSSGGALNLEGDATDNTHMSITRLLAT